MKVTCEFKTTDKVDNFELDGIQNIRLRTTVFNQVIMDSLFLELPVDPSFFFTWKESRKLLPLDLADLTEVIIISSEYKYIFKDISDFDYFYSEKQELPDGSSTQNSSNITITGTLHKIESI